MARSVVRFYYDIGSPYSYIAAHRIRDLAKARGVEVTWRPFLLGGYLGLALPERLELFGLTWAWVSPLLGVFALSAIARVLVLLLLLPRIREVRRVRPISFTNVIFRVTRVNALAGLMFDVVGTKPKPAPDPVQEERE